jgi:hypothetical protein
MNRQSYFLEQLCTIAVTGAYGMVMIAMFWSTTAAEGERTLLSVLARWIQWLVLAGGAVLLVLVLFRAVGVWRLAGEVGEHGHAHADDHAHHHHDHDHAHAHDHGHDHSHGHDHGWSPWRYAVLLFPLMLFLFPFNYNDLIQRFERELIGRGQLSTEGLATRISPGEAVAEVGLLAAGQPTMSAAGGWQVAMGTIVQFLEEETVTEPDARTDIGTLEQIANSPEHREHWKQLRRVEIEGLFNPASADKKYFFIARFRMACCINDARPAIVLAASRKPVEIPPSQWVIAQGRLDFIQAPDGQWRPVLRVYNVKRGTPPANPYLD